MNIERARKLKKGAVVRCLADRGEPRIHWESGARECSDRDSHRI